MLTPTLLPLALTVLSVTACGLFVLHFFRFVVRRGMFSLGADGEARRPLLRRTLSAVLYVLLYLLSSENVDTIVLTAIGVVGAMRVSCYYREELATDVARIVRSAC